MAHNADLDQQPLKGVVLCCTSLTQDVRTRLAEVAIQMGAVHKLDLTADVTHLLVGAIDTPKYRYVAKERPDIRVLSPEWIEAVRIAWMAGGDTDVATLEAQYTLPPFSGLQICLTGVEDLTERKEMESTITAKGGIYSGDLTKQVTHLVAARASGAKYDHAKLWKIKVVSLKWYQDCLTRGLALDENYYPPEMPLEQQGVGAFRTEPKRASLGKRERDDEQTPVNNEPGRKRLRKTASMRINAQSQEFWQDLSAGSVQVENTLVDAWNDDSQTLRDSVSEKHATKIDDRSSIQARPAEPPQGLFGGDIILIHGFDERRAGLLRQFLEPNGATIAASSAEFQAGAASGAFERTCLVVPHNQPVVLPAVPEGTILVSEWWVERCIHNKEHLDPAQDLLSSPLPSGLVEGFQNLTIATTGFNSVDFRQTAEAVKLMGATYQEGFLPSISVLVCATETLKKEKAYYAQKHRIPVVSAEWLWQSLKTRTKASIEKYLLKLPAVDLSTMGGSPSASSPAPASNPVPSFRRSGQDGLKRADELHPKRLSNTRRRQAATALPLSAPRPESKPSKTKNCPFVLEDDEDEETTTALSEPPVLDPAQETKSLSVQTSAGNALREISPNASQSERKAGSQLEESNDPPEDFVAPPSPPRSPQRSLEKENEQQPTVFTDDMATFLRQHIGSGKGKEPSQATNRKKKPLGRNHSIMSNRSDSASGSPALPVEAPEHLSPADGFGQSSEAPSLPPSTQLGYDAPDAEAHRREISKKMGLVLPAESGTRVASAGVVKDTREVVSRSAATKTRTKTRNRP